jgi:hypothetical protein
MKDYNRRRTLKLQLTLYWVFVGAGPIKSAVKLPAMYWFTNPYSVMVIMGAVAAVVNWGYIPVCGV